ncbi:MAG: hypothetical protein ACOCQF_02775 [Halanaerobiaceae bacterium]
MIITRSLLINREVIITEYHQYLYLPGGNNTVLFTGAVNASQVSITDWQWENDWPLSSPLPDHLWVDLGGGEEVFFFILINL